MPIRDGKMGRVNACTSECECVSVYEKENIGNMNNVWEGEYRIKMTKAKLSDYITYVTVVFCFFV